MAVTVQILVRITDDKLKAKSDASIIRAIKRRLPKCAAWSVFRTGDGWVRK